MAFNDAKNKRAKSHYHISNLFVASLLDNAHMAGTWNGGTESMASRKQGPADRIEVLEGNKYNIIR